MPHHSDGCAPRTVRSTSGGGLSLSNAHQCSLRRRTFHTCFRHTSAARGPSRALEKRACLLAVLPACGASTAARIKTVLQGRAPWHGPVACVPGQIHSSMVRPPYLSTARVPRPPVSLHRTISLSLRRAWRANWSARPSCATAANTKSLSSRGRVRREDR